MAEQLFDDTTQKLVKGGIEEQLFTALRANVDAFQPPVQGSAPAPGSISGRVNAVMKEFGALSSSVSLALFLYACYCVHGLGAGSQAHGSTYSWA